MDETIRNALSEGRRLGLAHALSMPRRTPDGRIGSQLGRGVGSSLEFREHREYQPGDDIRRIDWAAYARSDRLHVKLHHEEVHPHLDVLLDGSRSMALPGSRKAEAAVTLAAALATAAEQAGCTHAVYMAADGCRPVLRSERDPALWDGIGFEYEGPLSDSLERMPPRWRPRSIRVVIGDLLWPDQPQRPLRRICRDAAVAAVIQTLGRDDAEPPQRGNLRLVDSETGQMRDIVVDAAVQRRYRDNLQRHQQQWRQATHGAGAVMTTLIAEDWLEQPDMRELIETGLIEPA